MIILQFDRGYYKWGKLFLVSLAKNYPGEKVYINSVNLFNFQINNLKKKYSPLIVENHKIKMKKKERGNIMISRKPYVLKEAVEKFNEERYEMFCEEFDESTFDIKFYPVSTADSSQKVSGIAFLNSTEVETQNTFVEIFADMNSVTYTFTIEEGIGHNAIAGGVFVPYTEAGLYAGDVLFSLKTFAAKVKDESTKFVITWKIYF